MTPGPKFPRPATVRPIRSVLCGLLLATGGLLPNTRAQSPGATPANDLFPPALFAPLPEARTPRSDLAIVFWFDWRDPLGTFHSQAYDRRKGEYTPAVDRWLQTVRRTYPGYAAYVRYADAGARDKAKVVRETVASERDALEAGIVSARARSRLQRDFVPTGFRRRGSSETGRLRPLEGLRGNRGASGTFSGTTPPYPFPTPYPYPRPHP